MPPDLPISAPASGARLRFRVLRRLDQRCVGRSSSESWIGSAALALDALYEVTIVFQNTSSMLLMLYVASDVFLTLRASERGQARTLAMGWASRAALEVTASAWTR